MPSSLCPARRRRWPWWIAPLSALALPVATIRRTDHARTWQAAVVHVLGALLLAATGLVLMAWSISVELASPQWGEQFAALLDQVPAPTADPVFWAVAVVSLLLAEAALCVLAWLVMAWGARDELVPQAFVASLRRLWLLTPHAALVLLVAGLMSVPLERAHQQMVADWVATTPLEIPVELPEAPEETAELEADWRQFRAEQPWLRRNAQMLVQLTPWIVGLWILLVVLRAGAARPWGARCRWPPVCDGCGHSLLGRLERQACSECGLAVAASVGADARPGAPAPGRGWALADWWHAVRESVAAPARFGGALRAMHPEGGHRWVLAINAGIVGVLGFVGALAVMAATGQLDAANAARAGVVGAIMALGTVGVALVVASLVGSMATRLTLSPLLPAAMQGACHLSGLAIVLVGGNLLLELIGQAAGGGDVLPLVQMVLNVVVLVLYLALLWRIVMAARFANW